MRRRHYHYNRGSRKLGPVSEKILLLLLAGGALALTRRPDHYFRIVRQAVRAWKRIDERNVREAIRRLYRAKLVACTENDDGTVSLVLADGGKRRLLRYKLDALVIQKPSRWDGQWRMVAFDIPERHKRARTALSAKLKELGFYPLQKSVFVHPYDCKDEIDFVIELFGVRPFVRYIVVREIDTALDLKKRFGLR